VKGAQTRRKYVKGFVEEAGEKILLERQQKYFGMG